MHEWSHFVHTYRQAPLAGATLLHWCHKSVWEPCRSRKPHDLTLASQRMSSLDHCGQAKIHLIIVPTPLDHCIKQWILFPFRHPLSRCKPAFFEAVMWLRHVYSVGRWCLVPPSNRCGCVMSAKKTPQRLAALYARWHSLSQPRCRQTTW